MSNTTTKLRAVGSKKAQPGDKHQRRYDLEQLAALVTNNPEAGYGVLPIDNDVHPGDCVVCEGADEGPLTRDGHKYAASWMVVWVVSWVYWNGDEQGGGGFNWWPYDKEQEARDYFAKENGWTTAVVRLLSLTVPNYGTTEPGRNEVTRWIDADIDQIEGTLVPEQAHWFYDGIDDWAVILRQTLHLKQLGHDCCADESAEIKAWLRTYPDHELTLALAAQFPNERDEVGDEEYETADIAKVECLVCGQYDTEPAGIDLWNGYGDCPRYGIAPSDHDAQRHLTRWTYKNGRVVILARGDDDSPSTIVDTEQKESADD